MTMTTDASSSCIGIKWNHFGLFRRFQIPLSDAPERDIYKELLAKISTSVPDFSGRLAWKDEDGDMICFSSADEMRAAIAMCGDRLFRIHTIKGQHYLG
ncbi:unnamed protein product [Gongylonema pulchrum]|uniref:PB1 domain-containing protein n=1 Tax=Gongylonema pulchrum TaxID=637853 RepID=A0A3P7RCA8_9BILA|nr:unnamed protein product [Gongylonema pulchrum]